MKRAVPKLSDDLSDTTVQATVDDGELESARLHNEAAVNCAVAGLQMTDARIQDVQFTGAHFSRIVARDVVFERTDLSLALLDNGLLVRVVFVNCRMSGVDFSRSAIHDVTFQDCKLDGALFTNADLRRVAFVGCLLDDTDFYGAKLVDVQQ